MGRHWEHWSDRSDGSDRFSQYPDRSDWSDSVPVLPQVRLYYMATWHNSPLTCVLTDLAQHGLAILTGGDRVVNAVRVDLGEGKEDNRPGGAGLSGGVCVTQEQ